MTSKSLTSVDHKSFRFDFQDTQKFTDEGVMDDYMSPYMEAVVERQKKVL